MKARISGRAAAFAVKRARGWELGRRGSPKLLPAKELDVVRSLGATPDIVEIEAKSIGEVERRLEVEWGKDRALRITIALLDPSEAEPGLRELAESAERMLGLPHVTEHVQSQFYQQELPTEAVVERALGLCEDLPRTTELFRGIVERQDVIKQVRESWEALPEDLFGGTYQKAVHREGAVMAGAFRSLVCNSREGVLDDAAIFDLHERLGGLPNARNVAGAWAKAFGRAASTLPPMGPDLEELAEDYEQDVVDFGGGLGGHQRLRNALEQQAAILDRVADGDYETARKFASELVDQQLATAGPPYVAKSLTRLSQKAREMDAFELELEWAHAAATIQPDDARARTQHADALLQADRVDEAIEEFKRAYELGERIYALNGHARAMRMLGRFEDELQLYVEACALAGDTPEGVHSAVGVATAKFDLGDPEGALERLRSAVEAYAFEPLPRLALAQAFISRGRFSDAWALFEEAAQLTSRKQAALLGIADICLRTGRVTEARRRYVEIVATHPRDVGAHIGLIDTLRALGESEQAALYARSTAERFPGSPRALVKQVQTAAELGRYGPARQILNAAMEKFPKSARLLIAKITLHRLEGRYDRALQASEAAAARFPYNPQLQRVRADMLRRLDRRAQAEAIYRELLERDPLDIRARNGLASLLIVEGSHSEAYRLVDNDDPQTRDEWRGFLLFASVLERANREPNSRARLVWGRQNCPFAAERRLFACALAAQLARGGRARQAPRIEHTPERDIGNVIDFQIAAMTRSKRARTAYGALTRHLPERFAPLREEIAKNYGVIAGKPSRTKSWINRQLADNLLLAA